MMQGEQGREALRSIVANGEFFLLTLPDRSRLVHPIAAGVRHPLNFGREVCKASMLSIYPASACCSSYCLGKGR